MNIVKIKIPDWKPDLYSEHYIKQNQENYISKLCNDLAPLDTLDDVWSIIYDMFLHPEFIQAYYEATLYIDQSLGVRNEINDENEVRSLKDFLNNYLYIETLGEVYEKTATLDDFIKSYCSEDEFQSYDAQDLVYNYNDYAFQLFLFRCWMKDNKLFDNIEIIEDPFEEVEIDAPSDYEEYRYRNAGE